MESIKEFFGNKLRVRVCGFCWRNGELLLVNHFGLYRHDFWALPGGGLEFGALAKDSLVREFKEETGLHIKVNEFVLVAEFLKIPFHAIELFFTTTIIGGSLKVGYDPELNKEEQIIKNVMFMPPKEIEALPNLHKHGILRDLKNINSENFPRGYLKL